MDTRTQILALCGAVILGLGRVLDKKTPVGPNWSAALRLLLTSGLSLASGIVDAMTNHSTFIVAFVTVFAVGGPAFIDLAVTWVAHLISGSSDQEPPAAGKPVVGEFKGSKSEMPPPGPYSTKLMAWALAFGLLLAGCTSAQLHAVTPILNTVVTDVQDAEQVLNVVRSVIDIFLLEHASPDAKAKVTKAMADAQIALALAEQATNGVANLTQGREDEAFAGFKVAFDSLIKLLSELGIADTAGKVAAPHGGGRVAIPVPVVISRGRA